MHVSKVRSFFNSIGLYSFGEEIMGFGNRNIYLIMFTVRYPRYYEL